MIAITLAAGKGTRMKHLTREIPKTMVEFNGRSILSYQKEIFKQHKLRHYVVGGYYHEKLDIDISSLIINHQFETTNMVHSMVLALEYLLQNNHGQDVIISYGDIIYNNEVFKALLDASGAADMWICADKNFLSYWRFRMEFPESDLENFRVSSETGLVKEIGGRNSEIAAIEAQYIGLFRISSKYVASVVDFYKEITCQDKSLENISVTDFIQALIDNRKLKALPIYINSGWLEFDSDEDLNVYNKAIESKQINKFFHE